MREKIRLEITERFPDYLQNFDEKRQIGENDSYICSLIRNDSIEEFISYVNRHNYSLFSEIQPSIFETNSLLIENKNISLIQYAAFFGSIQVFGYLRLNGVELDSSLWLYAIHGNNAEIISLLEGNHVQPDDITYKKCLEESIKCHHNEIANYINNLMNQEDDNVINSHCFHYYNFAFFPENFNDQFILNYLCKYYYLKLVQLYVNHERLNSNNEAIFFIYLFI